MRKLTLVASAMIAACSSITPAFAGHYNEAGQFVGKVNPQVQRAFSTYKRTGDLESLKETLASLVATNPDLKDDAQFSSGSLPPAVRSEIASVVSGEGGEASGSGRGGRTEVADGRGSEGRGRESDFNFGNGGNGGTGGGGCSSVSPSTRC